MFYRIEQRFLLEQMNFGLVRKFIFSCRSWSVKLVKIYIIFAFEFQPNRLKNEVNFCWKTCSFNSCIHFTDSKMGIGEDQADDIKVVMHPIISSIQKIALYETKSVSIFVYICIWRSWFLVFWGQINISSSSFFFLLKQFFLAL